MDMHGADNPVHPAGRNHLQFETSPYLRQHADNPVDWFPWSDEAFRKAAVEDKPVFLSIGYSSCHWCHVMEQESFTNPTVAALLNESFVSVKVDREERPDIDQAYMIVAQAATGQGGWPLTVIMTPDRKPFFVATYMPPDSRAGRVGLLQLLPYVTERWVQPDTRSELLESASEIVEFTQQLALRSGGDGFPADAWDRAYAELLDSYDPDYGGFGEAPKFPVAARLNFLLRYWKDSGADRALEMVTRTLDEMRRGGIYDHLGSGFHRYSVDRRWAVPHFEKMLYDQALLAEVYLDAYLVTGNRTYETTVCDVLGYVQRRLTSPDGGFYCSEDADSAEGEGAYYLWTLRQLRAELSPVEMRIVALSLGISMDETGTVSDESFGEDQPFVLAFINPETDVAKALGMSVQEIRNSLRSARAKLLLARETRQPVSVDDKVVADWNGLTISAFARAGRVLGMPGFVEAASRAADFGLARMMNGKGVLMHSYKDGTSSVPGFLEDYASMARGLFELYQSSHEVRFLSSALQLIDRMVELFRDDADGGFFQVGTHGEQMVVRVKPVYDGALPSGNAVAAEVLAVASRLTERSDLDGVLRHLFAAVGASVAQSPSQHVSLLMGHRLHSGDMRVTVVTGEVTSGETQRLLRAAAQVYAPDNYLVLLPSGKAGMLVQTVLPVARDHPLGGAQSVAYVCTRTSCAEPLTEPIRLSAQLK